MAVFLVPATSQGRVAGTRDGIQPIAAQDVTVVHFLVQASLLGA
jgi:hypothetical protein